MQEKKAEKEICNLKNQSKHWEVEIANVKPR